jgi:transcriptional regulator with XRE-family HTH domain
METTAPSLGDIAARNVRALRDRRRLTVRELSQRLGDLGRPILPSGITKIEQGGRRIDVDDLAALAVALNTSPAFLLSPADDEKVHVVPSREDTGIWIGGFLRGETPLVEDARGEDELRRRTDEFMEGAPRHRQALHRLGLHPVAMALRSLETFVRAAVLKEGLGTSIPDKEPPLLAEALRREADRVSRYVHLLADEVQTGDEDRPAQYPPV